MLAHTRKHLTKQKEAVVCMHHAGAVYKIPLKIAEKYRVSDQSIEAKKLFTKLNEKYTKPGALLKAIRIRENLTQVQLAKAIKVTQSDVSQMENGSRHIGRLIAKRIEKLYGVDYHSFLE